MDKQRAQEIVESIAMINVNYHGIPVFIKAVQDGNETATIFPLDSMNHEQIVDLEGLEENQLF
ncbi:H-type small acid-soluble spore protein [Oceanobacillus sp. 143]|uniref:Small, acid-soluble spore protein H n=1 Tax=Oceanobacillus zhaokaii TaxID=2052660 RepID=A0A345PLG5_9BACI|nr:H-type small acid-soluble spore protein [Oceanobacillus zhaokaii]AXI10845.1 H-type small acid-soluble spore protein [Oceanobacillus zhaokaii]QGS69725.1 H-type small acid-soluble spore protein [Oceanobacillus sp. 143]